MDHRRKTRKKRQGYITLPKQVPRKSLRSVDTNGVIRIQKKVQFFSQVGRRTSPNGRYSKR